MAQGKAKKKRGRRSGESKTSPRIIKAKIQRAKAIELRTLGWTYQAIANEIGYASPGAAHNAVSIEMQAIVNEPAADLLKIELERLDKRERHLWSMLAAVDAEPECSKFGGDEAAYLKARNEWVATRVKIDAGLDRVAVRRSKILGLDAPTTSKQELSGPDGGAIKTEAKTTISLKDATGDQLERLLEEARAVKNRLNGALN